MASASIANRIKTVLDKLINKDQTGFISRTVYGGKHASSLRYNAIR